MRWTRKTILEEIRLLHARGEELNYDSIGQNYANLMRAASWHFGTWQRAVEMAGIDYGEVSKYIRWTREMVILGIREIHMRGGDLSWSKISSNDGDPALAAAAVRSNLGFGTWHDAVTEAGLDYDQVARYRHWTPDRVVSEIQELARKKAPLSSKLVQLNHPPLYNAAKRRFKQWDKALEAAGLDPDKVRVRRQAPDLLKRRRRRNEEGEMTFAHLERPEKNKRRSPLKSAFPIPSKPSRELPAPPKVPQRPLQRRNKDTGDIKMAPAKQELFAVLTEQQAVRERILQDASRKTGRVPRKGGYRAEIHGAAAKAARKAAQLELELGENAHATSTAIAEDESKLKKKKKKEKEREKPEKGHKKAKKK
ncbi:hypothetical protein EON83_22120 [bacterium]|nr:MAG: hypothetical protein EON83_22120 [bacterium]